MEIRSLRKARIVKGSRVIVRADFDVPLKDGRVLNDFRIREVVPTIEYILNKGGIPVIVAHLGRPRGKRIGSLSLKPVKEKLARILKKEIIFISDPFNGKIREQYIDSGKMLFWENIRFFAEEEKNDISFAREMARWGELYVNEAFAASHRKHATIVLLPRLMPSYAGLRLEREVEVLAKLFSGPPKPFAVVLGGAKLETKIPLALRFLKIADHLLIGGALANSFFHLKGINVGKSQYEPAYGNMKRMLASPNLCLPADVVATRSPKGKSSSFVRTPADIRKLEYIVDIGPKTVKHFSSILSTARTILWNGPLGFSDNPLYAKGTVEIGKIISSANAFKVVGGGDSIAVLEQHGLLKERNFTHVSTGGGAMLEFLAGKKLPGIEALR